MLFDRENKSRVQAWAIKGQLERMGPVVLGGGMLELHADPEIDDGTYVVDIRADASDGVSEERWPGICGDTPDEQTDVEAEYLATSLENQLKLIAVELRQRGQSERVRALLTSMEVTVTAIKGTTDAATRHAHVERMRELLEIGQLLRESSLDDAGDDAGDDGLDDVPVYDRRRRADDGLYFDDLPVLFGKCGACGSMMNLDDSRCSVCGQG
jgi:hypothetical protein